jgi:cytochrome P450
LIIHPSAHTLSFFFYSIAANPNQQLIVQEVIDNWTMQNGPNCSISLMPSYVEAVLKESMRMYPTAANGSIRLVRDIEGYPLKKIKEENEDGEVELLRIPKGTWVLVDIFSVQNCTHNWDKPTEFRPTRWLTKEDEIYASDDDFSSESKREGRNILSSVSAYGGIGKSNDSLDFLPFSYGPRNCLGMHLSLLELRTTIMKLCLRYDFEVADKSMLDDTCMAETFLTMRPKNKLPMYLTRRD